VAPKTDAAKRDLILAPAVVRLLRQRWLQSPFKGSENLVWCTRDGRGQSYRRAGDAFRAAVRKAGLTSDERLSLHSLRHGYASMLIAQGLDVMFVSRQLGHAKASTTLDVYGHLFAQADHAAQARAALQASYEAITSSEAG
jgi:integrase